MLVCEPLFSNTSDLSCSRPPTRPRPLPHPTVPLAASHLHRANGQRYLILIFDRGPLNNNAAVTMALLEFLVEIGIFDFAMAVLLQVLHSKQGGGP